MKNLFFPLIIAGLSLASAGCGEKAKPVKLAFIGPLTGGNAAPGLGGRNSFLLAVRQRNADVRSRHRYEAVVLDDECKPNVGVRAALRAASDPGVIAAVSHYCSMVAVTTADTFHKFGLPSIVWGAILPDITYGNDYPEIMRVLALTMEIDEVVSYPVPVPEGFIFFQVTGKKDASVLPFEEAREKLITILGEERARQEALDAARNALSEVRRLMTDEEYDFESAVEELGLKTVTTPFFTREGSEDIPASPLFVQASFLTVPGRPSEIVPTEEGFVFLTVSGREPAGPMPEDEEERWEAATRKYKAALVYDTWFNNLVQESKFSITNKDLAPQ